MELINRTPFAACQVLTGDGRGREILLTVVKATWTATSEPQIPEKQPPVNAADQYAGPPGTSSILQASDLALYKPAAEVVLLGFAYPLRAGDRSVDVSLEVAGVNKTIRVTGDRVWVRRGSGYAPSDPQPIERIPLVAERAYGGVDISLPEHPGSHPANPVGCGFMTNRSRMVMDDLPVPNLEDPAAPLRTPGSSGRTALFGWISPHWSPRKEWSGTYDEQWQKNVMPHLPRDFDPRFFQAAPADQVLPDGLVAGALVRVRNASPDHLIEFRIPSWQPCIEATLGDDLLELPAVCDTLVIDAEAGTFSLIWRARLDVHQRVTGLSWTSIEERTMAHVSP